ncbi:MAG: hypothetical protein KC643_13160 [Nitrospira sp.]|nr:hypothetical protein [Nitrospira sp.]
MNILITTTLMLTGLLFLCFGYLAADENSFIYWVSGGFLSILLSGVYLTLRKSSKNCRDVSSEIQAGIPGKEERKLEAFEAPDSKDSQYVNELAKYYRDFLETSFHKRREPRRFIRYRNEKNYLLGFDLKKYEFFLNQIWTTILRGFPSADSLTITSGKFVAKIPSQLRNLINKQVEGVKEGEINELVEKAIATIYEGAEKFKLRPLVAYDFVAAEISGLFRQKMVQPFLANVTEVLISQSSWEEDLIELVEDNLTQALYFPLREEVPELVNSIIAGEETLDVKTRFTGIFNLEFAKTTISTFFGDLAVKDLYLELQELMRNERLLDKQEMYLYFGEITFNKRKYPIFYIPINLEKTREAINVLFDSSAFINKKAIDYIVQEYKKERGIGGTPTHISDRIIYLEGARDAFAAKIQAILIDLLDFFELPHEIDFQNGGFQQVKGIPLRISNACHICIFDKSDEAIINDYEEILECLKSEENESGRLFKNFVSDFIEKEPASFKEEIEKEWEGQSTPSKLVYKSPIPLNEEQRKILMAVKNNRCNFIAVQGPPGTGKSHTITAILCDAILRGDSVLVLSDKKEALDVVEDKVTEVINAIRLGEEFQNPILRLGKAGNTYAKILSPAAIGGIEDHYKASRKNEIGREEKLIQIEKELIEALQNLKDGCQKLKLEEIREFFLLEGAFLDKGVMPLNLNEMGSSLESVEALEKLKNQLHWFNETFGENGTFLSLSRAMQELEIPNYTKNDISEFFNCIYYSIELKNEIEREGKKGNALNGLKLLNKFYACQLSDLGKILQKCNSLKITWFPKIRKTQEIKNLTDLFCESFSTSLRGSIFDHCNSLDAAYDILLRAFKKAKIRRNIPETNLDAVRTIHWILTEENPKLVHLSIEDLKNFYNLVWDFEKAFPETFSALGLQGDKGESFFGNYLVSLEEDQFNKLKRCLFLYIKYQSVFCDLPRFDFLEKKKQLEKLATEKMAHEMDGKVLKFFNESKATAQTLRSLIRKKQKFPKEDFPKLKSAFPCIISGIRDFSDYIPLGVGLFDIVIIDEASQVSVAQALPAIVRGKCVIVLGDTKQFSNLQSSLAKTEVNFEYLTNLEEVFKQAGQITISQLERLKKLNIKTSVLELFDSISNWQITLLKHGRGYREHISYSSKYFYNGRLQALKIRMKSIDDVLKFTVIDHDGKSEKYKNTNQLEIEFIKEELIRFKEKGIGGSLGIITPFHDQQIRLTDEINRMSDREYFFGERRLKIMTFDTCQGEERDTILYSMVANPCEDKLLYIFPRDLNLSFYDEEEGKIKAQRLNVGFSRAKECMHFILSKPVEDFKGSIGVALLHFRNELEENKKLPEAQDTDPNSPMEPKVLEWLKNTYFVQNNKSSIEIRAQFPIGEYLKQIDRSYEHPKYRTDFFLLFKNKNGQEIKIIIEYDGFHHFRKEQDNSIWSNQAYYSDEDIEREKTLESYGYKFLRLNRFNIGKDPVETLDRRLAELAI